MQALRHILSWHLIAALLIGQTGVSLHQIYCYCKGDWEARLFEAKETTCEAHEADETHQLPSCCSHNGACNMESGTGDAHLPCTEDQTIYLQLDKPAIPAKDADSDQAIAWADHSPVLPVLSLFSPTPVSLLTESPLRAPPFRIDGRTLQIWVQSFRC